MSLLEGFAPIGSREPRILILGSFPSVRSLERGEYYGHERNHFWPILASLLGFDPGLGYAERVSRLDRAGIAVWDIIAACEREGSLDQDIRAESLNPIGEYIEARPQLERVGLNGGKAASSFLAHIALGLGRRELAFGRRVEWALPAAAAGIPARTIIVCRLPSTSPVPTRDYRCAADKLPAWAAFLGP